MKFLKKKKNVYLCEGIFTFDAVKKEVLFKTNIYWYVVHSKFILFI